MKSFKNRLCFKIHFYIIIYKMTVFSSEINYNKLFIATGYPDEARRTELIDLNEGPTHNCVQPAPFPVSRSISEPISFPHKKYV